MIPQPADRLANPSSPSRRGFLGASCGALSGALGLGALTDTALAQQLQRAQKRVLVIFCAGGLSQFESWDPKPGRATGGPFLSMPTSVPGYRVSELMPQLATRVARHLAVIRSLNVANADHNARPLFGNKAAMGAVRYPSLGCMLAKELGAPSSPLPYHVMLSNYGGENFFESGGFLGNHYNPINIFPTRTPGRRPVVPIAPAGNQLPASLTDEEHRRRAELRDWHSRQFTDGRDREATLASHNLAFGRVRGLMQSDRLFDLEQESAQTRARYGATDFGRQALVARRLIEAGVPYVRVNYGWWDHHGQNFEHHHEMVPIYDHVLSTLLDDLSERGLLQHTLVVTFSEMGRTPTINSNMGRDHFPRTSATLAGCGIRPGVIHGRTDENGNNIAEGVVSLQQFFATIFQAVGIDPAKENQVPDGRPVPLTDYGTQPLTAVLA